MEDPTLLLNFPEASRRLLSVSISLLGIPVRAGAKINTSESLSQPPLQHT